MSIHYYLDVSLIFENNRNYEITAAYFKKGIVQSVRQLFGEVASSVNIDLLKYIPEERRGIVRVPKRFYVKVHSSLTLSGYYEGEGCMYKVHKVIVEVTITNNMSYCKKYGKDTVIFATEEDHKIPSSVKLPEAEPQPGLILPNGDINWNCPCLGGMATGPCGVQFRNAFGCFHYSEADPRGSDCYDLFKTMQNCMQKYPTLYNKDIADEDDFSGMEEQNKLVEATKEINETPPPSNIDVAQVDKANLA